MSSKHRNPSPASSDEEDDSEPSDAEETPEQQQQQNGAVEEEGEDESGGEEVEEEEEEDEDDDDEEEEEESSENKSIVASAANPPRADSPSGSGSETGSDSDDFPPSPNGSDFTIKPITSKPWKGSDKLSTAEPKKQASSDSGGDEEEEEDDDDDDTGVEESAKKGSGNKRLWNPDDEIALLKGMVEYQSKNGTIENSDMEDFHEFINKSLHVEVSKSQLVHKITRLKKKYHTNAEMLENGEDWDCDTNGGSSAKNKRKAIAVGNVNSILALPIQDGSVKQPAVSKWGGKRERKEEVGSFGSSYPCLNEMLESGKFFDLMPPLGMKESTGLIEGSKAKKLEKKWKKLRVDEAELFLKKLDLLVVQTKQTLKALKASSDS